MLPELFLATEDTERTEKLSTQTIFIYDLLFSIYYFWDEEDYATRQLRI